MAKPENSTNRTAGSKKTATYLSRMLQMNPLYEGDDVIALRARALGIKNAAPQATGSADRERHRKAARESLEAVRRECWSATPANLLQQLKQLDTAEMPDLKFAVQRLNVTIRSRSQLSKLTEHKAFDADFFGCLKQVLAGSARETAVLREKVVASFQSRKLRKRGQRMIKLLKRETPELYALEADWFETLMRNKAVAADVEIANGSASGQGAPSWVWWFLAILTARILLAWARGQ